MEHPFPSIRRTVTSPRNGARYLDPAQPSRLLMQAVLEDAIRTFLRAGPMSTTRAHRVWREELQWLTGRDQSHPFTFERICEALAIDPDALRARVLAAGAGADAPVNVTGAQSRTGPRGTMP